MKLVQFGAGNIGRSFIGQLFSRAGWEVVFVDIDERVIDELNLRGEYRIEIRDRDTRTIVVTNVRGVSGRDLEKVSDEVSTADLVATAVGKKALAHIMQPIASGLQKRQASSPGRTLDILICENMLEGARIFRQGLKKYLPEDFPLEKFAGFVETSIGKMVPIMSEADRAEDALLVYAEAYNTLILDRKGFKGALPEVPGLDPKDNIKAYVDRKLFIHNMAHGVTGFVGHVFRPHYSFVWEAAKDPEIQTIVREAMWESGEALLKTYPRDFDRASIDSHIEDLLQRFQNEALGDSIYRVGRDLYRKLGPDDRLIGSISLCRKNDIMPKRIALATACALFFDAVDAEGNSLESDRLFHENEISCGVSHVMEHVCRLEDTGARRLIERYHRAIERGNRDLGSRVFNE
jgi:mannitol-1-phosphate 5-dehydrogenase